MVVAKEDALGCGDCHGPSGRLDWKGLGYERDPLAKGAANAHEEIKLLDSDENSVHESGKPVSLAKTCGSCHDLDDDLIKKHPYHQKTDPVTVAPERRGLVSAARVHKSGAANCLACHLEGATTAAASVALASQSAWAQTATLLGTKLVSFDGKQYTYNRAAFGDEGDVTLKLGRAGTASCTGCHGAGQAQNDRAPFRAHLGAQSWMTLTTGQVFAGTQIRRSALNIAQRDRRATPWDVHAERMLTCTDCHENTKRPTQLEGKKVVASQGAKGSCRSCHDVTNLHKDMKEKQRHLAVLTCEACHIPRLQLGAAKQLDYTMLRADGSPLVVWRGVKGGVIDSPLAHISATKPVLGVVSVGNTKKLAPHNILSTWRWVDAGGKSVPRKLLKQALFSGGVYRAELIAAFDTNADKTLSQQELRLDSPEKAAFITKRLEAVGVKGPKISAEVRAYAVHHGVQRAPNPKDCSRCHESKKGPTSISLASYLPGGVEPRPTKDFTRTMPGKMSGMTWRMQVSTVGLLHSQTKKGSAK
ncbi:MAG: hypothetical protein JRH20_19865, partial [Deltaproteobacteria bacterium]|nr:hypothetical protein [Deltaproteobacteria bacterium]